MNHVRETHMFDLETLYLATSPPPPPPLKITTNTSESVGLSDYLTAKVSFLTLVFDLK